MQQQRFEQKYLVSEETALQIRDFVRCYLAVDEYGERQPNFSYPVHSLYLDSHDLRLAQETLNGNKNRYKLRLRFYNESPDTPVFFEIKRRMNNCIRKQRGGVFKAAVPLILAGHLPSPDHLISKDPKQLVAIQRFSELMQDVHAAPKVHVSYLREAYADPVQNSVRITLDRQVRACPRPLVCFSTEMESPTYPFGRQVILELKFTDRFPSWFRELVRIFGCMQCGAAKYVEGIELMRALEFPQVLMLPGMAELRPPAPRERSSPFRDQSSPSTAPAGRVLGDPDLRVPQQATPSSLAGDRV